MPVCSAAWKAVRSHVHRTTRCHLLLMGKQQGRTGGTATRLYVDLGFGRVPGRACRERRGAFGESPDHSDRAVWAAALPVERLWPPDESRGSIKERTWDDLPWAAHPVTLIYRQRRIICRRCGIRTERVEFADLKARVTRRLRQQIGVDCQSMPTSHAAVRHGVSWGKARRAERAFLGSGIAPARNGGPATSDSTRFNAGRDSASGPCSRTSSTAR